VARSKHEEGERSMRFLMLVCRDSSIAFTAEERRSIGPEVEAWVMEMERRGVRLQGDVLAPDDATATVRVRRGEVVIVKGPRLQTTEAVSGFNLLNCVDEDEAVEVAAKHPIARFGAIELKPFADG
jgi:hypothetical protein